MHDAQCSMLKGGTERVHRAFSVVQLSTMTRDERQEFMKILQAHAQTIAICEACAATTRDLAAEVGRGSVPSRGRPHPYGEPGRAGAATICRAFAKKSSA